MFQSRDENANRVQVALTLADGSLLTCTVRLPLTGRLSDALNNADQFLDIITAHGQQFIAKSQVKAARSAVVPRADQLDSRSEGSFDPYAILKVSKSATAEEIKAAYHRMARLYHPDRLASYELPDEVVAYVRAMLVRVNLAYEQLGK